MKPITILTILLATITLASAQDDMAHFDVTSGILTLPQVYGTPEVGLFTATLYWTGTPDFIFELGDVTASTDQSHYPSYYNTLDGRLFIPAVRIADQTYEALLALLSITSIDLLPRYGLVSAVAYSDPTTLANKAIKNVTATKETSPVSAEGDAADDPAIWIHPDDLSLSTVIGTQKQDGLVVYDLTGKQIQYITDGKMNNVDLRYGFPLSDRTITLVAASDRSNNTIALYEVNPTTRKLKNIAARAIAISLRSEVYGLCMYRSILTGKYYVFVNDKDGEVEQWEIFTNTRGRVDGKRVRYFSVDSQVEGCVADDILGYFYLSEENVGIWKFGAEPDSDNQRTLIDTAAIGGNVTANVEGLAIYYAGQQDGYLISSNQGNSTYSIYRRTGNNEYLGRFQIIANDSLGIDAVSDTDGIDVTNVNLGKDFPYGLFVVQDGYNLNPEEHQNYKFVPWEAIADLFKLDKNTDYDPCGFSHYGVSFSRGGTVRF